MARVGTWHKRKFIPTVAGLTAGASMCGAAAAASFGLLPPEGHAFNGYPVTLGFGDGIFAFKALLKSKIWIDGDWIAMQPFLRQYGFLPGVVVRSMASVGAGVATGIGAFGSLLPYQEEFRLGMVQTRGRRVRRGHHAIRAANQELRVEMETGAEKQPLLYLAPGVPMDLSRELLGFFILGKPGSGKTVFFRYLLSQILHRSARHAQMLRDGVPLDDLPLHPDKIIAMDVKGDVVERWPNDDFIMLAPHDTGFRDGKNGKKVALGYAWDIGRDIVGVPAARDFAMKMIPSGTGEHVTWSEGAQNIFAGMLRSLQIRFDTDWGWKELHEVVTMTGRELREYLELYDTNAANYITVEERSGELDRTASSYMGDIRNKVVPMVEAFAASWGTYPKERRISLNEWILDPNPAKRTIIMQRSGKVRDISARWMRAALFQLASFATSPDLNESKKRRVWFMCDEAPQYFSKDDGFLEIIEVGRSKGFCTVVAAQVKSQYENVWSKAELETIEAMMGTKLIFQTGGGSVAKYLAEEVVGSSDWERRNISRGIGKSAETGNVAHGTERELVVMPNWFEKELGVRGKGLKRNRGVLMAWVGAEHLCRFLIPFNDDWNPRRKPTVTARWVNDNKFRATPPKRKPKPPQTGATGGGGGPTPIAPMPVPQDQLPPELRVPGENILAVLSGQDGARRE